MRLGGLTESGEHQPGCNTSLPNRFQAEDFCRSTLGAVFKQRGGDVDTGSVAGQRQVAAGTWHAAPQSVLAGAVNEGIELCCGILHMQRLSSWAAKPQAGHGQATTGVGGWERDPGMFSKDNCNAEQAMYGPCF